MFQCAFQVLWSSVLRGKKKEEKSSTLILILCHTGTSTHTHTKRHRCYKLQFICVKFEFAALSLKPPMTSFFSSSPCSWGRQSNGAGERKGSAASTLCGRSTCPYCHYSINNKKKKKKKQSIQHLSILCEHVLTIVISQHIRNPRHQLIQSTLWVGIEGGKNHTWREKKKAMRLWTYLLTTFQTSAFAHKTQVDFLKACNQTNQKWTS